MRRLKAGGGKEAESLLIYSKDDLWYTQTPHIGGIENQLNGERTVSQIRRLRSSNRPRLKRVGEKRKRAGFCIIAKLLSRYWWRSCEEGLTHKTFDERFGTSWYFASIRQIHRSSAVDI